MLLFSCSKNKTSSESFNNNAKKVKQSIQSVSNNSPDLQIEHEVEYMLGEPIVIKLIFSNPTDYPIKIEMGYRLRANIAIKLEDKEYSSALLAYGGPSGLGNKILNKNQQYSHSIVINEWINFNKIGKHELTVSYHPMLTEFKQTVKTKTVINIKEKKSEDLKLKLSNYYNLLDKLSLSERWDKTFMLLFGLCYSNQEEVLPFLDKLKKHEERYETRSVNAPILEAEIYKGISRIGTETALNQLLNYRKHYQKQLDKLGIKGTPNTNPGHTEYINIVMINAAISEMSKNLLNKYVRENAQNSLPKNNSFYPWPIFGG
jgi:hypothetical protein